MKNLKHRVVKYWSFSFSISPSSEYSGLISFRIDCFDLLAVQRTIKSLLQHHSSKASILQCFTFFIVQLSHPYTWLLEKLQLWLDVLETTFNYLLYMNRISSEVSSQFAMWSQEVPWENQQMRILLSQSLYSLQQVCCFPQFRNLRANRSLFPAGEDDLDEGLE